MKKLILIQGAVPSYLKLKLFNIKNMQKIVPVLLLFISTFATGQESSISFSIEKLSKPEELLQKQAQNNIYESLILSDVGLSKWQVEKDSLQFSYDIIARSKTSDSLVNFGYNSFFNGIYQAYADHRPFVFSPDMIWLLISQGFARHVNANSEELRKYFVNHSGKLTLLVRSEEIKLDNPNSPWEFFFLSLQNK